MARAASPSSSARHILAITAALLLVPLAASAASPMVLPVRLVSSRHVEIPGTRILSMSPDGSRLAALRPQVGFQHGELCTFDTSTLAQVACASLQALDAGLRLDSVAWSPDSSHLTFAEEALTYLKDGDLWLVDAATGALTNLDDDGYTGKSPFGSDAAQGTITVPASPTFTADGSAVTYSRSTFRDGRPAGNDIATVPIAGGAAMHLVDISPTAPGLAYFGMRWAPDGGTLYYSLNDVSATSMVNGIWAVDADGTGVRFVAGTTETKVGEPAVAQVSSDGTRLLAWYPRSAGQFQTTAYDLSLIDPQTGTATPLVIDADPGVVGVGVVQMATFSPDGTRLAEVTFRTEPDHQVLISDLASGDATQLIADGLPVGGPAQSGTVPTWAANGTLLIPGGAALSEATLLTIENGLAQ
jgi:Tol biopolymer transport system component